MSEALTIGPRLRIRARAGWVDDGWPTALGAFLVAAAVAVVAIVLHWQGGDLPAQIFRADLVRRDGFVIWNQAWFGGHATLSYSVLSPLLSALVGPVALGAISGVVSAVLFERIVYGAFGRRARFAAMWFASATATNLIVGRVTFALGVTAALTAVLALQRRRAVVATVFAVLSSLLSPVAGCFLALAAFARMIADGERRRLAIAVVAGAAAPLGVLTLLFPTPGFEPFELWNLVVDLALCAAVAIAAGRHPALRWGAAVYAVAVVGAFVVPTALGGNVNRFAQYLAGPLLACLLLPRRRVLLAVVAVPLVAWQWYPAVDGIAFAGGDPSTRPEYYAPLLGYLGAAPGPVGRVEIIPTSRHWEAAYVAPHVMLARGWERQLDIAFSPMFYTAPVHADDYQHWLGANAVEFVAVPDAPLDASSLAREERALVVGGLPYLHEVWHDAHWRVWRVDGFHGLVDGPATLTALAADSMTLTVQRAGDVVVHIRASGQWSVPDGGCAAATSDGWTVLRDLRAGTVVVSQSLRGTPCPQDS